LYNIPIEPGSPMRMVRLRNVYLNETYNSVRLGNHLSDIFFY